MKRRFRVLTSLLDMEGRPRISHPLSSYIEVAKDKSGAAKTVLRIPYWARQEAQPTIIDEALVSNGALGGVNGGCGVSTSLSSGSSQHSSPGSSVVMNSIGAASRRGSGGTAAAAVLPPMSPVGASAAAILSHRFVPPRERVCLITFQALRAVSTEIM